VIHGRDGEIETADRAAGEPERLEGLRARDLVDEVEVDVEKGRLSRGLDDDVRVPDAVEQRPAAQRSPSAA
jgi:hypothetical protein